MTLHSDGDLELDAPDGAVRITARDVVTHAERTHAAAVGGAHVVRARGGVTLESGAQAHVRAAGEAAVVAGGVLSDVPPG